MRHRQLLLPISGLTHIPSAFQSRDFSFIINNKIEFQCNNILAEFLSPKIAQIRSKDPSINRYFLNINGNCPSDIISITPPLNYYPIFFEIFQDLQNKELLHLIYEPSNAELNMGNVFQQLQEKKQFSFPINKELSFISEHFFDLDQSDLKSLTFDDLFEIFSNPSLCIENEDSLLSLILSFNSSYHPLLSFVEFENLKIESIQKFLKEISFYEITSGIWSSITKRLLLSVPHVDEKRERYHQSGINIPYDHQNPLNGICNYISDLAGGNAHKKEQIEISVSSTCGGKAQELINYRVDSEWYSYDRAGQWISVDFKQRRVSLTGYSLQSAFEGPGKYHPKSWDVEGSDDGQNWTLIDSEHLIHVWEFKRTNWYKFIRIKLTGLNHYGNNFFNISHFEFFGRLLDSSL